MSKDSSEGSDGFPDPVPSNIVSFRGAGADREVGPDKDDPLWFMNPDYNPCPEHDVVAGDYRFRYRPEYERYFIARGLEGQSLVAISAELAIPFSIIRHWALRIKSLAVALDMSRQNSQLHWETVGREAILDKRFNGAGWLKMMAIRYPESWREIEAEAKVTALDPYGFDEDEDQGDAMLNAEQIYDRLMRIKDSG